MTLQAGLTVSFDRVVTEADTAVAHRSGDVSVLATPQVLAWCEEATMSLLEGSLEAGESAVGMRVRLDHVRPTPVGASVRVNATLALVEGRRLTFEVMAVDDRGEIATGQIVRVVVNRSRFLRRLQQS